jgi:hypothetical protein
MRWRGAGKRLFQEIQSGEDTADQDDLGHIGDALVDVAESKDHGRYDSCRPKRHDVPEIPEHVTAPECLLDDARGCGHSIEASEFSVIARHHDLEIADLPAQRCPLLFAGAIQAAILPHHDDDSRRGQRQPDEKSGVDVPPESQRNPGPSGS